jgi:hypothetical protein
MKPLRSFLVAKCCPVFVLFFCAFFCQCRTANSQYQVYKLTQFNSDLSVRFTDGVRQINVKLLGVSDPSSNSANFSINSTTSLLNKRYGGRNAQLVVFREGDKFTKYGVVKVGRENVNVYVIRNGFGKWDHRPSTYSLEFENAEKLARRENAGVWANSASVVKQDNTFQRLDSEQEPRPVPTRPADRPVGILQFGFLLILLWVSNNFSHLIGGILYFAFTSLVWLPRPLGSLFQFLIAGPIFKLTFILKLITWGVAGGGMLLGFLIYEKIYGEMVSSREFYLLVAVGVVACCSIMHDIVTFNVSDTQFMDKVVSMTPRRDAVFNALDEKSGTFLKSVARTTFTDMYIPQFFRLLISISLVVYGLSRSGVVEPSASGVVPSVMDCMLFTFSFVNLSSAPQGVFEGGVWVFVRFICSFIVLYWTVMFVSLASSLLNDDKLEQIAVRAVEAAKKAAEAEAAKKAAEAEAAKKAAEAEAAKKAAEESGSI